MGVAESFPERFFEAARKAVDVFDSLRADWMFVYARLRRRAAFLRSMAS